MSFIPFLRIKSSSVVSVWYVDSIVPLAFSATIIPKISRPSHLQMRYSQELLYFFLYVSYLWFTRRVSFDIRDHHQAINDLDKSYDTLVDLFESFGSFLSRLDIYTKIPSTTAITQIIVKILAELLSTISLAMQQVKQGRLNKPYHLLSDANSRNAM